MVSQVSVRPCFQGEHDFVRPAWSADNENVGGIQMLTDAFDRFQDFKRRLAPDQEYNSFWKPKLFYHMRKIDELMPWAYAPRQNAAVVA